MHSSVSTRSVRKRTYRKHGAHKLAAMRATFQCQRTIAAHAARAARVTDSRL